MYFRSNRHSDKRETTGLYNYLETGYGNTALRHLGDVDGCVQWFKVISKNYIKEKSPIDKISIIYSQNDNYVINAYIYKMNVLNVPNDNKTNNCRIYYFLDIYTLFDISEFHSHFQICMLDFMIHYST